MQKVQKKLSETSFQDRLDFAATHSKTSVLRMCNSQCTGLCARDVLRARARFGSNALERKKQNSLASRLVQAFINPFSCILFVLALIACINDMVLPSLSLLGQSPDDFDCTTFTIITTMITVSGILRFVQESKSANAAQKLMDMVRTTVSCLRDGDADEDAVSPSTSATASPSASASLANFSFEDKAKLTEIQLDSLVVGDIVYLSTGDIVPADVRILSACDLFVNEASLTGESELVEKFASTATKAANICDYENLAFMGTTVISGSAWAVVVSVGAHTMFGTLARALSEKDGETSFSRDINSLSWVLIRFMIVMVPVVLAINGFTKGDWTAAALFALSIAVGLTPEMLPMIVTACLAKGAVLMSKKQTIVKNLNAIQNFGAMDILLTDKTGTLTKNDVVLEYHLDIHGQTSEHVLRMAYLNSYFQTGYKNLMDKAIIEKTEEEENNHKELLDLSENYKKIDEIPFDFKRRRLSVVVAKQDEPKRMVTKGAAEEMLAICSSVEDKGEVHALTDDVRASITHMVSCLNERGFRVLALASKDFTSKDHAPVSPALSVEDEADMVFLGVLAFLDPPKESAKQAIQALAQHGVATKILTGDNEKVTKTICKEVGLPVAHMLLGSDIEGVSDEDLYRIAKDTAVFAKLSPQQKARIVALFRRFGHSVGYMGDGINDTAAMKAADIGISVDSACDVAKEAADIILLKKDLTVLEEGILAGRRTFANMIKYIKITVSSNFGNVFSVLVASFALPFLPMQSTQLIMLNLIYDISCTALPWDKVDRDMILRPRRLNVSSVPKFMAWFGPVSSIFDIATFACMFFVICPMVTSGGVVWQDLPRYFSGEALAQVESSYMMLFQTAWFVESMWSQTLVVYMLRTSKLAISKSLPSKELVTLTMLGIGICTLLPFTPLGHIMGLVSLPGIYFAFLFAVVALYMLLVTCAKKLYLMRYKELL